MGPRAIAFTRRVKAFGMDSCHVDLLRRVTATMGALVCEASFCTAHSRHKEFSLLGKAVLFLGNGTAEMLIFKAEEKHGSLI